MSEGKHNTVSRTIQVLESLFENDFKGGSETEISQRTSIPLTSVFRILKTLKLMGWVFDVPVGGTKARKWKVDGKKLVSIAFMFKKSALNQVHMVENEFRVISGEVLRNGK